MFTNNNIYTIKMFMCFYIILISFPAFSYDQFDIQVCKAISNESERDKCLTDLKGDFSKFNTSKTINSSQDINQQTIKKDKTPVIINKNSFHQVGYFKDKAKNRIFTIEMKGNISKSQALTFAQRQPNTIGQTTAVYFYSSGSTIPANGVTLARNMFKANKVLYEIEGLSNWRYAYIKGFNGSVTIVDCLKNKNELCRD